MNILTISLGRNILKKGSREESRMQTYAKESESLHIIVLTRKEHQFSEVVHNANLHIYPTNSSSRIGMLIDAYRIGKKIIAKSSLDSFVVSAQDPLEIGWLSYFLSRKTGSRLHIQVHGDYFSTDAWVGSSLVRRIRRVIAMFLLKKAPRIRVVSYRIKNSLVDRGILEKKITVLPIRPELEAFLRTTHEFKDVGPYTFLYIGRLAPEKDIPRILKSFALLINEFPQTKLNIIGDGDQREYVTKFIQSKNLTPQITLSPWTENVAEHIAASDVVLLASKHEAYALTLIESLACGVPVITTDVGSVGEVVQDSIHGIVVREGTVDAYAAAMKKMVRDTEFRKACGIHGRRMASQLASTSGEEYARAWVTSVIGTNPQV